MSGKPQDSSARPDQNEPSTPATRLGSLLEALWILLLVAPAATTASVTRIFDSNQSALFIVSCWLVVATRLLFVRSSFFVATLPIVAAGVLCMGADFLRGADPLALVLQWRTYSRVDVAGAVRPYIGLALCGCAALAALSWACWRTSRSIATRRPVQLGLFAGTVVLAVAVPGTTWLRAWPVDGILVVASAITNSRLMAQYLFPASSTIDPRNPNATWKASRVAGAPNAETVVFIVGETIRNDYLKECHGPERVRAVASGALVACDVTSGSDTTDTSVPLMVSRELPGHAVRVSDDATFLRAFQETGFETWWISAQAPSIAWADARRSVFPDHKGFDTDVLLPPLATALAGPAALKALVLHANNAHDPYCARYDQARAPYPASCVDVSVAPSRDNLRDVRLNYANAVDSSIGFVNDVIAQLEHRPEPAFLVFSPDHAENLLDDSREIWGHARRDPTQWDTHVPAIFWANDAWRATHAVEWAHLRSQIDAPLMHVDLVPTLLSAAGIRYEERRTLPVDLLTQAVPPRGRVVQHALNATVPWQTLVDEARAASSPP